MSEFIKITILIEDVSKVTKEMCVAHETNMTLMSTLLNEGLISGDNCGGRGVCGRCRLRFMSHAPIPTGIERNILNSEELRQGYRLACMAKPQNDCVIRLEFIKNREIDIVTEVSDIVKDAAASSPALTHPVTLPRHIIAVDLGTTTIAMQLMELESGKVIDTYSAMNPQRAYGADVLSRIQAANEGHAESMKESVWKVISDGVDKFLNADAVGGTNVSSAQKTQTAAGCICIAGNTTMEHLLMGLSTKGLGQSPFKPEELGLQKCVMDKYKIPVYITPGISAFVGGDITAGLYHCNLLDSTDITLFIDLGTNGEMAIAAGDRIIVTATAAGPAFEGGVGASVPGSDMVKLTAELLEKGIIDETGLLAEPYFDNGIDVTVPSQSARIHITQADIRALQMAKAAIRAGIDILCSKIGNKNISRVYLAGGFGYYLDVDSAVTIGLLPKALRDCTKAAGNTSLAGTYKMGRDLLTDRVNETALIERLEQIESINLANEAEFEKLYIKYMNLNRN